MACFNRNTQEYKNLLATYKSNMQVDSIITAWQKLNKTDKFPSVREAEEFLDDQKTAFSLKQRSFEKALLANLSRLKIISKLKSSYYVNNSNRTSKSYNPLILQSNVNKAKRYLEINNIPLESLTFEPTSKSMRVKVNNDVFTAKDMLESSRSWDKNRSKDIVVHLMRLFPNVKVSLTSVAKAKAYYESLPEWQKANVPFTKVKSYYDPAAEQVVLIKGRITDDTPIEEMLHPFIDAVFVDNKPLFDNLLKEAKKTFPVLAQQINDSYFEKRGFSEKHRDLELVTQALTRHFKKEYEENPTKTFLERVQEFIEWFAGIINNLHKYITGKDIPAFKRDIDYYQGDQALMEQEERFDEMEPAPTIKPGVQELFESNPELANQVYEALGFSVDLINSFPVVEKVEKFDSSETGAFFSDIDGKLQLPSNFDNLSKKTQEEYLKHEFIHLQIWKKFGKNGFYNNKFSSELFKISKSLYSKYVDNRIFDDDVLDIKPTTNRNKKILKDIKKSIKNTEEFFTYAFTDIDFATLLKDEGYYDKIINWYKDNVSETLFPEITPQQKQQALQVYSQYLDTIFPDSKVKDIVYHGTDAKFEEFDKSFYQSGADYIYFGKLNAPGFKSLSRTIVAVINLKNPSTFINNNTNKVNNDDGFVENYSKNFIQSLSEEQFEQGEFLDQYGVKKPEQIHILGNKQDIEGFKEFVSKSDTSKTKPTVYKLDIKDINPNTKLSDIAKLLNTSDIQFDTKAKADLRVRFSLTEELQSTVDYALRQSNAIQSEVIKRLFHQAQEVEAEVGSLSAGEGGPIVVLNEENHVYYNVLDTTEVFKSTTERIKGKLSEDDMFNKKLNIDLGNDFDKLLQGLASDKTLDETFSQMNILSKEQAEKAYAMLQENLKEITRGGGVAIPQVVVYDQATKTAGSIDILVVMPDGKLRIVDLKTSKNSISDMAFKEKAKIGSKGTTKYDTEYELGDDSDLKQAGIDKLSTRAQQAIQVNAYRRMLENMGYQVDMGDMGASTFHIQVGITGKDAAQVFTGEFKSDEWVGHPISQNKLYVDLLIPENKDTFSADELEKAIEDSVDQIVNWEEELSIDELLPDDAEFVSPYQEYEVITQALENYRVGLTTKLDAIKQIKSSIYMDRTREQTEENIHNTLSLISAAMDEGPKARSALYSELLKDVLKQIKNFADYVKDPENFGKDEYITYVLNFERFIKTFEGLYSVKSSTDLNATQRALIAELQIQLNELGKNDSNKEGLINQAITNYVKEQIKTWSNREDLTEDVLDDIINGTANAVNSIIDETRDIGNIELNTYDLSTSRNTILAIMDKIYKVKKREMLDKIETRNSITRGLSSRLQKLSPNKNPQELYDYMLEFDENGEYTGRYVKRLGEQYFKKQEELRSKLFDENGNWLDYRDVTDVTTASKEDLEYNKKIAKAKAEYADFWRAEQVGKDGKRIAGDYHRYTDEFIKIREQYEYYKPVNGKVTWIRKSGVSDKAYQLFKLKYFGEREYTYAKKDQNGEPTGAVVRSVFSYVKEKYRVTNDFNTRTGESILSEQYEKIMNPTDALGEAQKAFYLHFVDVYENDLLNKIPPGHRTNMLGRAPIVKGKIFQDVKGKPNAVAKLWARTTRSIKNFTSTTAQQRGIVVDENGDLVDQLPVFYTGNLRTDEQLEQVNADINTLNEKRKKGFVTKDAYDKEMALLNGRLATLRSKPSLGELSKDLGGSLMKFSAMAEHYETMSTVEDTYKAFIDVLEKREYQPADPAITLGKRIGGKFKSVGRKKGLESNTVRRAKKWMAMVFYDNEQITKGFLEKVSDTLMTLSSETYVAWNPFGSVNNYAMGRINNSIESLGQRFVSFEAMKRATLEFNKRAIPDVIKRLSSIADKKLGNKSDYDPDLPGSKYEALVDFFFMMDEKADIRETTKGPETIKKSYFRQLRDFGYVLQDAAEYNVQTKLGIGILLDTMIMNKATGDIISLYDTFDFDSETKSVKLKEGYDTIVTLDKNNTDENGNPKLLKEQPYNDQFRYMLSNEIREKIKQIHGNYAKDDRMVIQSYAIGRLAAQFHKWVAPAMKARFRREYFDENLGWMEGRYRSFLKFLEFSLRELSKIQTDFSKYGDRFLEEYGYTGDGSQRDQRAKDKLFGAYRTLGEIAIIMSTLVLSELLNSMFEDDDDENENIKRFKNMALYQADRTYKELILFTPLGTQQVYQMLKSPIASTRTLGELGEALSLTVRTPIFYLLEGKEDFYADKDFVYQRGTRKGELKLNKNWADVLPIIYSIKKWDNFLNLTNFYIK